MNDLYLASCPLETDLQDLECDECGCYVAEVNPEPKDDEGCHYVAAFTAEEETLPQRLCDGCANKLAARYKGTVHDRREDAEKLLRDAAQALVRALDGALVADRLADRMWLVALLDRINRR